MTHTHETLSFLLAGKPHNDFTSFVEAMRGDDARRGARVWVGSAANTMRKEECSEVILRAMRRPDRIAQVLRELKPHDREILAVVARYGGAMSGVLLYRELIARGLIKEHASDDYGWKQKDPVFLLCEKQLLIRGRDFDAMFGFGSDHRYPNVEMFPEMVKLVTPAPPAPWHSSDAANEVPESTLSRAPTEFMLELSETARALDKLKSCKLNQGGVLSSATRNRLVKSLPEVGSDPFIPPDPAVLSYMLLRGLKVVDCEWGDLSVNLERLQELTRQPLASQAWAWVKAWLDMDLWQDGIGGVPDHDGQERTTRIFPHDLARARQMLVWALGRLAQNSSHWIDLDIFLGDLYRAVGDRSIKLDWYRSYYWRPHFAASEGTDQDVSLPERMRTRWFGNEAIFIANALMCTLVHFGLVERGHARHAHPERWSFRLTEVGRAVFGAPDVAFSEAATVAARCLTVQPSFDVIAYLDACDGNAVTTLSRIVERVSAAGIVQTFKISRESICGALESGMTLAHIRSFLESHGRSALPDNVAQTLAEWARKRDAIVVRRGVTLFSVSSNGSHGEASVNARARALAHPTDGHGENASAPPRTWSVDEMGAITVAESASVLGRARLGRFAIPDDAGWRITAESAAAARERGITAEQIARWLSIHTRHEIPAILTTAIANWTSAKPKVFLGDLVVLQIPSEKIYQAILASARLKTLIERPLGSDCLLVRSDKREPLRQALVALGFRVDDFIATKPHEPTSPSVAKPRSPKSKKRLSKTNGDSAIIDTFGDDERC